MIKSRALLRLLLLLASTSILGVPLVTLLPIFARDILKIGASGYGMLVGAFGAGAVLGAFSVAYRGDFRDKGRFVLNRVFLFVLSMMGFSQSRWLLPSILC